MIAPAFLCTPIVVRGWHIRWHIRWHTLAYEIVEGAFLERRLQRDKNFMGSDSDRSLRLSSGGGYGLCMLRDVLTDQLSSKLWVRYGLLRQPPIQPAFERRHCASWGNRVKEFGQRRISIV